MNKYRELERGEVILIDDEWGTGPFWGKTKWNKFQKGEINVVGERYQFGFHSPIRRLIGPATKQKFLEVF